MSDEPTIIIDTLFISAKGLILGFRNQQTAQVGKRDFPLNGQLLEKTNELFTELYAQLALTPEVWPERQMKDRKEEPTINLSLKDLDL